MNENPDRKPQTGESGKKKKTKKRKSPALRFILRFVTGCFLLCVIIGCIVGCYLTVFAFDALENGEVIELDLDMVKLNYTTIVRAPSTDPENPGWVELMRLEGDEGSRVWVDYEDMPPHLFDVLIAVEDKRFDDHNGVDWQRTILSFVNLVGQKVGLPLYEGTPGASTITQQVVRNLTGDDDVSPSRKLREIFRALTMEKHYSKDQILESYLNTVPFGNNTHGIQAAANLYFDKDVSELTVAECASIIGITKAPTNYNPYYTPDNNSNKINGLKNNQDRKEDILFLMQEQGKLTQAEYQAALDEKIVFNTENNTKRTTYKQSYFEDYLMTQVTRDLAEAMGITTAEASTLLYRGGYTIDSTVDTTIQKKLEDIYENPTETMPKVSNVDAYPQSSFIITDTGGAIKGLVGGIGEKEGARVWNRATDTKRQPGSTIKPLASYSLAIETDLIHWSSLMLDGPYSLQIDQQPPWRPRNYYNAFTGYMSVEIALQRSCNLVPVRIIEMLSPKTAWTFMHDTLNVQSLEKSDISASPMSLGALTYGVTPLEMAGAYQMFSNGGTYTEPYTYTEVRDSKGNVVLKRNTSPTRVITFDTATVMNKLLQRVVTGSAGTGRAASLAKTNPSMPVAGKTGTTDDDVDQWFIGMSPYYIGVCWMGFDDQFQTTTDEKGNKTIVLDGYGNKVPNSIRYKNLPYPPPILWNTVMTAVHEGIEAKQFPTSSNVVSLTYCMDTGYAATTACERVSTGWYKSSNIPSICPMHGINNGVPIYNVAGQKPWLDEWAPWEPQWAWLYPNAPQVDEEGNPIIPPDRSHIPTNERNANEEEEDRDDED